MAMKPIRACLLACAVWMANLSYSTTAFPYDTCESHSDCPISHFCKLHWDNGTSAYCEYCVHCQNQESVAGACPEKCQCQSDLDCSGHENDDSFLEAATYAGYCAPLEYWQEEGDERVCESCLACQSRKVFSLATSEESPPACAETCYCSSSNDCPTDFYCSNLGDSGLVQEGRGMCVDCSQAPSDGVSRQFDYKFGEGRCLDDWMVSLSDNCQAVCPRSFECNTHDDCIGEGSWCRQDHRCQPCSYKCHRNGLQDHPLVRYQTFSSIDGQCPETCCNWDTLEIGYEGSTEQNVSSGLTLEVYWSSTSMETFLVGFCQESDSIQARWTKGFQPNWNVSNFDTMGKECQQTLIPSETPPFVVTVDCTEVVDTPICTRKERALAISSTSGTESANSWYTDPNERTPSWTQSGQRFRLYQVEVEKRSDSCPLTLFFQKLRVVFIAVTALCVLGCAFCLSRRCCSKGDAEEFSNDRSEKK